MSLTKTQLIVQTATPAVRNSPPGRFLLPATDGEDMGLVMRLDTKMEPRNLGNTPIGPAKLCQMPRTKLARWVLFSWNSQVDKVSASMQKLFIRLLPVMLYLSLLVSAIQAAGVLYLLASSVLSAGVWFLLICIGLMGYFYVSTSVQGFASASSSSLSRRPSNSSSSNITPSSTSQSLASS